MRKNIHYNKHNRSTSFAATRAEQQLKAAAARSSSNRGGGWGSDGGGGSSGGLYAAAGEAALEAPDAWLVAALYGLAAFVGTAGLGRAYHALSGLGATAALLAWRHLQHG
jgi:hypothetical protein